MQDKKNGKPQPWRSKKIKTLKLAASFKRLGQNKKAGRVYYCASALGFRPKGETGEKKLDTADFCRERLCPMCQWRKSMKVFYQVSRVMDRVEQEHNEFVPVFLTLTLKNCKDGELKQVLDNIFHGWNLIIKNRQFEKINKGWFRALEVTYNHEQDTFHPHIHALIMVEKSYFKKDNKSYMQTTDWVKMWRTAMKLDYDPVCDIRKVTANKGKYKAVAEVAKYTLKDSDFLTDDKDLTDKLVDTLGTALKGRRLFAFGGLLKKIAKQLGIEELAEGDLVHIDEMAIRADVAKVLEVYRWDFGLKNYVKSK